MTGTAWGVVTNAGTIVWPDRLMMLFARDMLRRNPRRGRGVRREVFATPQGSHRDQRRPAHHEPHRALAHQRRGSARRARSLGGEFSGLLCFAEGWYGFDDALYSGARLLAIVSAAETTVEALFGEFPATLVTPEIKVRTTESAKFEIVERLAASADFGDGDVTSIDGIRVDYPDGFGLVRASNTSPVLSLRFEADTPEALDRIRTRFQSQLVAIDAGLRFE